MDSNELSYPVEVIRRWAHETEALKAIASAARLADAAWNSEDNDALTDAMAALNKALAALESEATDGT